MTHYVCSGSCEGVSKNPGVCTTEGCDQYSEALDPCDCNDDKHLSKLEEENDSEEDE